jgi:hypothetical protein
MSGDGTYVTDQFSRPFFINADTAWSLIVQLNRQDVDTYLSDRQQKGYNAVLANLIDHKFSANAPANIYGDQPFLSPGSFNAPNEAYFAHADYVVNKAAEKNIVVFLDALYIGYQCTNEGWCQEIRNSSLAEMRAFGRFVGNRYRNAPNIVWVIGGDVDAVAFGLSDKVREFVAGIKDYDSAHLMTAHNASEQSARDVWPNEAWLNLNSIYTYNYTYLKTLQEYNRAPFQPSFLLETAYENEHGSTPLSLRSQSYGAVLSGAYLGHFFGNCPIWGFGATAGYCSSTNWKAELNSPGSQTLAYVGKLFASRQFYRLVPDQTHTVLTTAGYQSGAGYAATSRTGDGSTVIAYIPTARTVTIDMTKVAGTSAQAWWFDPRTSAATLIGNVPITGSMNFTTPSGGDWVLVIDNAALGLPAPGD